MVKSLNTKWKEFVFALSGFGPNFLMVLMGAYFTDAINPVAFAGQDTFQAIMSGTCFILPALFPILYAIAKAFDGIIDIPFAHITDTLSTKWGRRRPAILVCMIPMIVSFAFCWWPIGGAENQLVNTIWIIFWALVFFSTYTMCLIAFYGSLSSVCVDEPQRLRVSGYKSFFDTISYCFVYALVPIILSGLQIRIDKFVFICLPLMLTIAIPLFMIKEGAKYGYPENEGIKNEKISMWQSIRLTFGNKMFSSWLLVNCCTFFGLQMFLSSMNTMIIGGMGFNGGEMAILNTCAFAPVPIMLYLFNKLKAKKGVRFTYQSCLLAFAVSILCFFFGSLFMTGGNKTIQYAVGITGSLMGSWSIGAFFMMPYLAPAQISSVEERLTGKNHSAMYFAGNAVFTSIVGAISSSLVYENIKMLHISKDVSDVVWAENITEAASKLGADVSSVYNLGTLLIPFIVAITCVLGFFLAFRMPKDFTPDLIAKEFKKQNPSLDISAFVKENSNVKKEKGEIIFVQIGLSILSGFIFGFIWIAYLLKSVKELLGKAKPTLAVIGMFIPFVSIFFILKLNEQLRAKASEKGIDMRTNDMVHIIFGILFPLFFINVVSLSIMQHNINTLYKAEENEKELALEAVNA